MVYASSVTAAARHQPPALAVVAPGGRSNPSARVRVLQWVDRLTVDAAVHTYLDSPDVRAPTLARRAADVAAAERQLRHLARRPAATHLLLQREATPLSAGLLEERLLRGHAHSAYDLDDALYVPRSALSPRRLLRSHQKAARLAAAADVVVAGSDVLFDWARDISTRAVRIPSCVDLDDYPQKTRYELGERATLLWVGSVSTERYLHALAPALAAVGRRVPVRVLLVGVESGRVPPELAPLVERRAWSEAAVRAAVQEADLGLMPLPDNPFTRGKCAYKLLQYAAAALPVIGSPVGASRDFLTSAGAPAPATTQAWTGALLDVLTADAARRHDLGTAARAVVARHYTYDVWQEEWLDAVLPD